MPAVYAHYQFGENVLQEVVGQSAELICKHKNMFRIGLQGPDLLFFYRPFSFNEVAKQGLRIHAHSGYEFFKNAAEKYLKTGNENILAYLLGCVCHYTLDKSCHLFVNNKCKDMKEHHRMESEFDSLIKEKYAIKAEPYQLIPNEEIDGCAIAAVYDLTEKQGEQGAKDLRTFVKVLQKRKLILFIETLVGKRGTFSFIAPHPKKIFANEAKELFGMFLKAKDECVGLIDELYGYCTGKKDELDGFALNFEGVQE